MPRIAHTGSLHSDTGTTQVYPLGTLVVRESDTADYGEEIWVYVFNDEASTAWAQGDVIIQDPGAADPFHGVLNVGAALNPALAVLGVAQHAVAAGSYGFVLKEGIGELKACDTGADQDNAALVPALDADATTTGVDVMADGEEEGVFAYGLENAAASAGALFTARIRA